MAFEYKSKIEYIPCAFYTLGYMYSIIGVENWIIKFFINHMLSLFPKEKGSHLYSVQTVFKDAII